MTRRRNGRPPPATHARLEFEIAGGEEAPAAARKVVEGLETALDQQRVDQVRLLVTELVTNCVRHAGAGLETPITVSLELTATVLHVAVSNPGGAFESPDPLGGADGSAEGGRGLMLVDEMADEWGVAQVAHGKQVWFRLAVDETWPYRSDCPCDGRVWFELSRDGS
jgi:anti-sigma regulatory factor (Ser/Thr protein kinase)